jgi:Ca2+-binding RTX toxin-like protein
MSGGFATIGGGGAGDDAFDLDPKQAADIDAALRKLGSGRSGSEDSREFGKSWLSSSNYNVYHLDGGTIVPFAPVDTDAVVLDGANPTVGSSITASYDRATFWVGNQGNDTFSIGAPSQTILGGDGDNSISLNSRDHSGGANEIAVRGGHNTIQLYGNGTINAHDLAGGGDSIVMHAGYGGAANAIHAGDGNDTITFDSWGDAATVQAGNGADSIDFTGSGLVSVGGGNDTITFGGNVSISAAGGATVTGSHSTVADSATVTGGSGSLVFTGGSGNDSVTAGSGAATLTAGSGNDTFHAGTAGTALLDAHAGSGADALYGGSGSATLLGGSGNDSFFGGSGSTSMVGGTGYSIFQGGSGSTTMVGGSGWNLFTGGSGSDTMVAHTVTPGVTQDLNVFNFDAAVGGNHEIDGYSASGDYLLNLQFTGYGLSSAAIVADAAVVGSDTVISIPAGTGGPGNPATTITLKGYTGLADWNVSSH